MLAGCAHQAPTTRFAAEAAYCYAVAMEDHERLELEAAIAAHCDWLEQQGFRVPAKPEVLEAWQLFSRPWALPEVSQSVATAVLSNLAALCAFRTREGISERRTLLREAARRRVAKASPQEKASQQKSLAMVEFAMDDSHIGHVTEPLGTATARTRTLERALNAYVDALKKRHKKAAALGLGSTSLADIALARWIQSRCQSFEADLEFLSGQLPGQEVVPHTGPTTAKAWHRLRGECLLRLKEAAVPRAALLELLPPARAMSGDPERAREKEKRRTARDDKSIKRARERRSGSSKRGSRTSKK